MGIYTAGGGRQYKKLEIQDVHQKVNYTVGNTEYPCAIGRQYIDVSKHRECAISPPGHAEENVLVGASRLKRSLVGGCLRCRKPPHARLAVTRDSFRSSHLLHQRHGVKFAKREFACIERHSRADSCCQMSKVALVARTARPWASTRQRPRRACSILQFETYATSTSSGGTGRAATPSRRAITVTTDDGRIDWGDLSTGEKAARTTQQSFNFLLVAAGAAGTVL